MPSRRSYMNSAEMPELFSCLRYLAFTQITLLFRAPTAFSKPFTGVLCLKMVSCASISAPRFPLMRFSLLATRAQLPSMRGLRSTSLEFLQASYLESLIFSIFFAELPPYGRFGSEQSLVRYMQRFSTILVVPLPKSSSYFPSDIMRIAFSMYARNLGGGAPSFMLRLTGEPGHSRGGACHFLSFRRGHRGLSHTLTGPSLLWYPRCCPLLSTKLRSKPPSCGTSAWMEGPWASTIAGAVMGSISGTWMGTG
mmetsp:Transcript_36951/g.104278  ORF Transcript_36951/g.104278 Transcript_36951/m.104278 type:complete len:252 (+) Transcript_36951:724-1479(+)